MAIVRFRESIAAMHESGVTQKDFDNLLEEVMDVEEKDAGDWTDALRELDKVISLQVDMMFTK